MKKTITLALSLILLAIASQPALAQESYLEQQRENARVKQALADKEQILADNLSKNGLTANDVHILITAYKAEKKLEIYAKKKTETEYRQIAVYDICNSSGVLGPKRQEGDLQVPEGFYTIDRFNPWSNYYLSLGINYPNQADRKKSNAPRLGGDIFIHGDSVTIGCLPMSDDKIKEIYLYAVYAKDNGQSNIPVYIFPFRMTDENLQNYKKQYAAHQELLNFWTNLKTGYDKFFSEKKALNVSVDREGNYLF